MKLTPKQNSVVYCLQQGCVLITDMEMKGAIVGGNKGQFHINNGLFWRLVDMGIIHQSQEVKDGHAFTLTKFGKELQTKAVDISEMI